MRKTAIDWALRILLGGTFIASGILKLYPIEPFELNFIDLGVANWNSAPIISRVLIALELLLGSMFICGLYIKKITVPLSIALLLVFSGYLLIELATAGNRANCGCFGTYLRMTPLQSLIKNALLIFLSWLLFQLHPVRRFAAAKWVVSLLVVASFAAPFILNPVDAYAGKLRDPDSVNIPFPVQLLQTDSTTEVPDFMSGKKIVACLSLTCEHCRTVAFKIHVMKERHPEMPFFFILNGKENQLEEFYEATRSSEIPYMFLHGKNFYSLTGGRWPSIYWMNNGVIKKHSVYINLQEDALLDWLNGSEASSKAP